MDDEPLRYTIAEMIVVPIVSGVFFFVFVEMTDVVIGAFIIWLTVRFFNGLSNPRHAELPDDESDYC
jgi:hypothetical protein